METTLAPEDEQIVQRRLESGVFFDASEVIHRALQSLDAEDIWLQTNKGAIHEKIGRGLAQPDRGEGVLKSPELISKRRSRLTRGSEQPHTAEFPPEKKLDSFVNFLAA